MPLLKHLKCTSDLGSHFKELLKCSARKDPAMMKKVSGLRETDIFPSASNCSVRNHADEKEVLTFLLLPQARDYKIFCCLPSFSAFAFNKLGECVCVCVCVCV
uniref:Uncharacterized protein n=1 Tax=Micrurus corallinus TaxID=54390 RepID=A0A2D4FCR2_MICCO